MHMCVLVADEGNIYDLLDRFSRYDDELLKPESRWDYFGLGGRYAEALPLKKMRIIRRFFGLLTRQVSHVACARKCEVDQETFLKNPPVALFFNGQLHEIPVPPGENPHCPSDELIAQWHEEFRRRFAETPEETCLQIVDAHS